MQPRGEPTAEESGPCVLSLIDADQHALTCEVGEVAPHDFTHTEPCGVGRHEQGARPGVGGTGKKTLEFFSAHQMRQRQPARARGQVEVERIPAEGRDIQELASTGHLVAGTPRQAAFDE